VAFLKAETANVMRPTASFHRHDTGRKLCQEVQKPEPLDALSEGNRTVAIKSRHAAHRLAQVDPKNRYFHQNSPSSHPFTATIAASRWEGSSSH